MQKLTELNPRWVGAGGPGIRDKQDKPVPARHGVAISFDCPCGCDVRCYVAFSNPIDLGPAHTNKDEPTWNRTGDTFETLTLRPSILRSEEKGGCGWHGYITNGLVGAA